MAPLAAPTAFMSDRVSEHAMEWTSDDSGERYTRTRDGCEATVWRDTADGWEAIVSREGAAVHTHKFEHWRRPGPGVRSSSRTLRPATLTIIDYQHRG